MSSQIDGDLSDMISFSQAQRIIWEASGHKMLKKEFIPLKDISGRVSATDLNAPMDVQPFDNTAMDGFAVRLSDLVAASPDHPVMLKKSMIIEPGSSKKRYVLEQGTCIQIMTGAPMPEGAEAIVPVEEVVIKDKGVVFTTCPKQGAHIRTKGEDFKKDAKIIKAGERLTIAHILPLATLGISQVLVYTKPKILFLSTGKELVDAMEASLKHGEIYNANKPFAMKFLEDFGMECHESAIINDDIDQFIATLNKSSEQNFDMIISSGAVSAGLSDFVKSGLEKVGANILYHKIKLKPGKPNLFATLPSGPLYFGLPGNPVATVIGLRFFLTTALRAMTGQSQERPMYARAKNHFSKKPGLQMILKGKTEHLKEGLLTVDILDGQESFMVRPFLTMNSWVFVPEEIERIIPGEMVEFYPFTPE